MPMFWGDPTFMLLIPALIFALIAQGMVKSTYKKFSKTPVSRNLTGAEVARKLLDEYETDGVEIEMIGGELTDHYDPRNRKLRLSKKIHSGKSIAAIGIAAHEAGHAMQHSSGYAALQLRNLVYPVASFGSSLAFPLFFIGMFFMNSKLMMDIGILLYKLFSAI